MHILREHDGMLYVVFLLAMSDEPVVTRHWYPTGIKAHHAHSNLGVESLDGEVLYHDRPGFYRFKDPRHGRVVVELSRGGDTLAEHVDRLHVPLPKTRRRGAVVWSGGRWEIKTKRGHEVLVPEQHILADHASGPPTEGT